MIVSCNSIKNGLIYFIIMLFACEIVYQIETIINLLTDYTITHEVNGSLAPHVRFVTGFSLVHRIMLIHPTRKSALRGTYTPGWCPFLSINIF